MKKGPPSRPPSSGRPTARATRNRKPPRPEPAASPIRLDHHGDPSLTVVGIGASAGGLEALTSLLSALPADLGMAFVIVQHLAPSHESMLAEILSRATPMRVREVTNGMPIEPNRVYVIPPNANMTLLDGALRIRPYVRVRGRHLPIDDFFQSLADTYGARAIGVVLSGVASDGALGCRAIKAGGGITFAQSEATARFAEMPRSAVAAGSVDFVDSPPEIAREIARIARHPALPPDGEADEAAGPALERILVSLRTHTGIDFSHYRKTTLRRRIHRRMVVRKVSSLRDYADILRREKNEISALYEDILITVTSFFRDAETFELLQKKVYPRLLKDRPGDAPIRIWVPGCSTGEEVYSIAIALFEAIEGHKTAVAVQIFGTDISEKAIDRARAATYHASIEHDVSPERLRKYFVKTDAGYQITKAVREVCVFARQNVGADPPFSNLDLISCRNLLIYIEPDLQKQILPLFHYALKPSGYLLLGPAETIRGYTDLFEAQDKRHRLFAKRTLAAPPPLDFRRLSGTGSPPRVAGVSEDERSTETSFEVQRRADRLLLARYAPVGAIVDRNLDVLAFRGQTGPYLEPPPGAATFNVLRMAREGLVPALRDALNEARRSKLEARRSPVSYRRADGRLGRVAIAVVPLHDDGRHFLVSFEPLALPAKGRRPATRAEATAYARIEHELSSTKDYLQSIIEEQEATNEELTSANEEILSSNEELQSTNEELETAKEELQSTNEELRTVNDELSQRNNDLAALHGDITNVLASIQVPMIILDAQGHIRRYTPLAEKLLNVIPGDVGRPFADLSPNIRLADFPGIVRNVVENVETLEREVQAENGQWYLMRVRPYLTHDQKIDGAVVMFFDIDPVKLGVEQINRARDYAETLVETVREGLVVLDRELRVRTANRAFYAMFETSPLRVEGKRLDELPGWKDPDLIARLDAVVRRRESVTDLEWTLREEAEATPRTLVINARGLRVANEPSPLALIAIQDITERKRAEAGLRESEGRYRRLFEKAREGILLIDGRTGKIIDANAFLVLMLGRTRDQVVGKTVDEVAAFRHPAAPPSAWEFAGGDTIPPEGEIPLLAASGGDVWVHRVCGAYEADGRRMIQCNLRDITAAKHLQQQLWQSQKLESMGSLAGGIAHDFNNILGILSGYVGALRRSRDGEKASEALAAMEKAIERGAALVRQLLAFARRSDGDTREPIDVNRLADELAGMLRETFPKNIALRTNFAASLPPVSGDANQVHQALLNLAVNARDAMRRGGTLTLRTEETSGDTIRQRYPQAADSRYATIGVGDTGDGMDAETRRRIFEPFFTTKGERGGSGLGLAVAYGIVKSHRGFIDVESEPGKGTTFMMHLPAADGGAGGGPKKASAPRKEPAEAPPAGDGAPAASAPPSRAAAPGTPKTVLLVEDEPLLLDSMRALVESEGYRVLTATDGSDALRVYDAADPRPDVVVSDVKMPRLGGWEAYLRIRERDPAARMILASGIADRAERQKWKEAGVRASLRKPFNADEFLRTLKDVAEH